MASLRPRVPFALLLVLGLLAPSAGRARERGADGNFDRRQSTHFVLFQDVDIDHRTGPHGSRRFERELLGALEDGHALLDDVLGLRLRRRVVVHVYDAAVFDARFAGRFRFPAAGFYGGEIHVKSGTQVSPALVSTLHHELVHAALDAAAPSLLLPAWLNEGLAEWFEARAAGRPAIDTRDRARLRAYGAAGRLAPPDALAGPSLVHFDAQGAAVAYLQSRAMVDQLVRLRGDRVLRELVRALIRTRNVDRALERAARLDAQGLDASLRSALGVAAP